MPNGNNNGDWRDSIRAAQAVIWVLLVLATCGLMYVLNEVAGSPIQW